MKIKVTTVPDQIYHHLVGEIINGSRKPGEKVTEEKLCAEYGISRTPVREALLQLTQDGLLERIPNRGCFIKEINREDKQELFEARCEIELVALDNGFANIDRNKLEALKEKLLASTDNEKYENALKHDEEMHSLIYSGCQNKYILDILRKLYLQCRPFRSQRAFTETEYNEAKQERIDIINAILDNQQEQAKKLLKEHILSANKL